MNADVMPVRLHLRGVRVTKVVVDTVGELVVGGGLGEEAVGVATLCWWDGLRVFVGYVR